MQPTALTDNEGRPFTVRRLVPQDRRALEAMYEAFEPKRAAQGLPPHEHAIPRWLDRVLSSGEHLVVDVDGRCSVTSCSFRTARIAWNSPTSCTRRSATRGC